MMPDRPAGAGRLGLIKSYAFFAVAWMAMAGNEVALLPVLSRIFQPATYGSLLLVLGVTMFLADAAAIWASSSFVRIAASRSSQREQGILFSAVVLSALAAVLLQSLLCLGLLVLGSRDFVGAMTAGLLLLPGLCVFNFAQADYQASRRSSRYAGIAIGRFLAMAIVGLAAVFLIDRSATAFLAGAGVGLLGFMTPYCLRSPKGNPFRHDARQVIREASQFGFGVWFQNLGAKTLRIGDRYVIGALVGAAAVGVYGAGYTLFFGGVAILVSPLVTLVTPTAFSVADRDGESAVSHLLSRILRLYVPFMFTAVWVAFLLAPPVVRLILPRSFVTDFTRDMELALLTAAAIHGATLLAGISLAVQRKTFISGALFAALAIVNVVGNLTTVPWLGIRGAAYVTLLSYAGLFVATIAATRKGLPVHLNAPALGIAVAGLLSLFAIAGNAGRIGGWETAAAVAAVGTLFSALIGIISLRPSTAESRPAPVRAHPAVRLPRRLPVAFSRPQPSLLMVAVAVTSAGLAVASGAIVAAIENGVEVVAAALTSAFAVLLPFISVPASLVILVAAGRTGIGPLDGTLLDVTCFAAIGLAFASGVRATHRGLVARLTHPIALSQIALVAIVILGYLNTAGYDYAEEKTLRVALYGVTFLVIPLLYLSRTADVARFFFVFAVGANLLGLTALLWTLRTTPLLSIQRISAPSGGPITLARVLAFGAIACMTIAIANPRWRMFALANGVFLFGLAFLSGSRGPAIFLFLVILCMPFVALMNARLRTISPRYILALILFAILAVPVWNYAEARNAPFVNRFDLLLQRDRGVSVDTRIDYYQIGVELAERNSWQGYGTGGWAVLLGDGDTMAYPHNIFLELLVEQGLIGVAAFTCFVVAVLLTGIRRLAQDHESMRDGAMVLGAFSCFVFALLAAQTSGDLFDNRSVWFFGGLVLALKPLSLPATARARPTLLPPVSQTPAAVPWPAGHGG